MSENKQASHNTAAGLAEPTVMQHTLGPWVCLHQPDRTVEIATVAWVGDWCVGVMTPGFPGGNYRDLEWGSPAADAHLIAAAPNMLNALRSLLRHAERQNEVLGQECGIRFVDTGPLDMARDALRLAVGAA